MLDTGVDQAQSLRRLFGTRALRVLPVVGCVGLAELYARALAVDRRVVVLDHAGEEVAKAFGRVTRFDLASLLWGDRQFEDVAARVNDRLSIIPARAGLDQYLEYAHQHRLQSASLFTGFLKLPDPFEWLVVHTRSLSSAAQLMRDAGEVVLVMDDSVEAVQQTYLRIKEAAAFAPDLRIRLVVRTHQEARARQVCARLCSVTRRFVGLVPQFGLALPTPLRPTAQLGARLRGELSGWHLAEYEASDEAVAA